MNVDILGPEGPTFKQLKMEKTREQEQPELESLGLNIKKNCETSLKMKRKKDRQSVKQCMRMPLSSFITYGERAGFTKTKTQTLRSLQGGMGGTFFFCIPK